jgi:hypothetical protein
VVQDTIKVILENAFGRAKQLGGNSVVLAFLVRKASLQVNCLTLGAYRVRLFFVYWALSSPTHLNKIAPLPIAGEGLRK